MLGKARTLHRKGRAGKEDRCRKGHGQQLDPRRQPDSDDHEKENRIGHIAEGGSEPDRCHDPREAERQGKAPLHAATIPARLNVRGRLPFTRNTTKAMAMGSTTRVQATACLVFGWEEVQV